MVGVDGERSGERAAGSHVQGDVKAGGECSAAVVQALDERLGVQRRLADGLGVSLELDLDGTVRLQRHDLVQAAGCSGAAVAVFLHAAASTTTLVPPFRVQLDGHDRQEVLLLEAAPGSVLLLSQQVYGRHSLAAGGAAGAGWHAHQRGQHAHGVLLLAARLR